MSEKVMIDIVFNPDTKQLEKQTTDFTEKNKVKVKFEKPDVKELEGPFKELQEKAMAMANGGFSKGLGQLKSGVAEFGNILKGGGDTSTALAGGLSKIGMEGATVFAGLAAGSLAAGAAFAALYDKGTQLSNTFKSLGVDFQEYSNALNGAVNAEQAFAIRNAARTVGLQLSARQLAEVSNFTDTLGQRTGDLQGSQQLVTQALQGNKEAMYQLGIQYSQSDTEIQRATRSVEELSRKSRELGAKDLGFFERVGIGFGRLSDRLSLSLNESVNQYAQLTRSQAEAEQISANAAANRAREAESAARATRDSQNRSSIETLNLQQQERSFALATNSLRVARDGESTREQLLRSEMESLNINGQINNLKQLTGGSEKDQLERRRLIADLERREAAEIQRRNQLQSFSVQLADAQRARLVQMAVAQANHTGQNVKQLSLAEQLRMAEAERGRIVAAIVAAGNIVTDTQQRQLEQLQTFINQGRQQQAQSSEQTNAMRRQNELSELALRYSNEEARARGEAYRLDVDSINLSQRKLQIESALSGLYAYRGRTAQQESARLAEIQRRTQELQQINQIMQTQEATYAARRQSSDSARLAIATNAGNRMQEQIALSQRAFAIDQTNLNVYNEIIARQQAGTALTQAETEYLQQYNNAVRDRVMLSGLLNVQIANERANANDTRLSEAERIQSAERLNALLSQRIGLQRQEQERSRAQSAMSSRLGQTIEGLSGNYKDFGDAAQGLAGGALQSLGGAFSNLISTAIEGKTSFGDAMLQMTRSVLTAVSQQALVQGLFQLATGFAKLAIGDAAGSSAAFTSAALFGAVGAVAGVGAGVIPKPAEGGGSGGGGGSSVGSGDRGVTGVGNPEGSDRAQSGPIVINFNMKPYSTQEDIEKGIAMTLYSYEQRTGRSTRRSR